MCMEFTDLYNSILSRLGQGSNVESLQCDNEGRCSLTVHGHQQIFIHPHTPLQSLYFSVTLPGDLPSVISLEFVGSVLEMAFDSIDGQGCALSRGPDRLLRLSMGVPLTLFAEQEPLDILAVFLKAVEHFSVLLDTEFRLAKTQEPNGVPPVHALKA